LKAKRWERKTMDEKGGRSYIKRGKVGAERKLGCLNEGKEEDRPIGC